eukprot:scaffold6917_cov80-Skeletonema_marinoi.AAC.1
MATAKHAFVLSRLGRAEKEATQWTEPNDSTYILFFQACERLLSKGHRLYEQVIETVVYSCVRDGQMSAKVMHALHNIAPDLAHQFEKIDAK